MIYHLFYKDTGKLVYEWGYGSLKSALGAFKYTPTGYRTINVIDTHGRILAKRSGVDGRIYLWQNRDWVLHEPEEEQAQ